MTLLLLTLLCTSHTSPVPLPESGQIVEQMGDSVEMPEDSIRGRTIRWTWTDGPTAGVTHEHEFRTDGTVEWRVLTGPQKGHTAEEEEYAVFEVSEGVHAVSYLAESGYTLTVVLDFSSGNMYGVASGNGQWFPGRGTFEIVD